VSAEAKDERQRVSRKMPLGVRPWDVVKLQGCTSLYRVYSRPGGGFIYACLHADCIATSNSAEVERVIQGETTP
jgi:hypothetical protein